jgi:hypothetical protein
VGFLRFRKGVHRQWKGGQERVVLGGFARGK